MGALAGNRRWAGLLALAVAAFACFGAPSPAAAQPAARIYREVLPNGLTVLVKPNPANEVVAVEVYLRSGVRYEPADRLGVSALVQRTMLKGTESRTAEEIAVESESAGSYLDARTGIEYAKVSLRTTLAGLDKGLEILFDVLRHPTFPEKELERERGIALQEIAARDDHPANAAFWQLLELFYGEGHPYARFPLGSAQTLPNVTRDQVVAWYRQVYVPNNIVIAAVGRLDPEAFIERVRSALGDWQPSPLPPGWTEVPTGPQWTEDRNRSVPRESEAAWIVVGFPVPGFTSPESATAEVLANVLGGGMSSRLFTELREEQGLAYAVAGGYQSFEGTSVVWGFLGTPPPRAEQARQALLAEFRKVAEGGVTEEELSLAKNYIRGTYLIGHETNADQASYLAWYELLAGGYERDATYPDEIAAVTADAVQALAREATRRYALVTVGP